MATINTTDPKPGYVYNADDDTWYPLQGIATQSLDGLTDVVITSAASGQALVYNGTNWVNTAETGDISALTSGTGITLTNATGPIPTVAVDTALVATTSNTMTMSNKTLTSPIFSGTSKIAQIKETTTVSATTAATTVNYDVLDNGAVTYYTNNSGANWTLNLRGSSTTSLADTMSVGESLTVAFLVTNGSTAYYQSAFQIDGTSVTPKWQGGTAATAGNASSVDIYSITATRVSSTSTVASAFTVFESQTKFA